MSITVIRL